MASLIVNLGSDKFAVHNSTFKVLKAYIQISHNIESVLSSINWEGLQHLEAGVWIRILETIPLIIACEPGVIDKCPYEFRKLIESIFLRF